MDIVTDLTAQSVSFLTVLQDVCQRKGVLFCEEANEEKFLGDIIDFPKFRDSGNERELIKAFDPLKERILEIIWSSTGEKESDQAILCFVGISEKLLAWIKKLMPPISTAIGDVSKTTGAANGSIYCSPYQWRCIIRTILYEFPEERIELVRILHYMPIQIILSLGGANLSSYRQRLYQIWEPENAVLISGKDKASNTAWWEMRHEQALIFLVNHHLLLDQLVISDNPVPFDTLYSRELDEVSRSREKRLAIPGDSSSSPAEDPQKRARDMQLVGLALSGGGIRSATFNLGVIQQLAERDFLKKLDYLSTVSGGGYIGAWLVSWIKRTESISKVTSRLNARKSADPLADEVRPVRWLRMYSNFLTPDSSIMSADSWTVGITWLRNTIINQVILLLLLCAALSSIWVLYNFWIYLSNTTNTVNELEIALWSAGILLPGALAAGLGMHVYDSEHPPQSIYNKGRSCYLAPFLVGWAIVISFFISSWLSSDCQQCSGYPEQLSFLMPSVIPIFIAAIIIALLGNYRGCVERTKDWVFYSGIVVSSAIAAVFAVVLLAGLWGLFKKPGSIVTPPKVETIVLETTNTATTRIVGTKLETITLETTSRTRSGRSQPTNRNFVLFVLAIPVVLEVLSIGVVARMAIMGRLFPDERREWWGRMGAIAHRFSVLWLLVMACVLLLPGYIKQLNIIEYLVGGWTVVVGYAVKLAYSPKSEENKDKSGWTIRGVFLRIAPYLFMIGFLLLGGFVLREIYDWLFDVERNAVQAIKNYSILAGGLFVIAFFLSWRVGVNEFSLHHFYKNRLVRAFLGATRRRTERRKTANNFTGFDKNDDLKLADFVVDRNYCGPYPIINTAMNSTVVSELDRQDRKAEAFVFTPLFSGFDFSPTRSAASNRTRVYEYGYRQTSMYGYKGGPTIGTAMAISGAAVNPNMGYHSSSATAFLLTMFNVRLGWWIGNPRLKRWRRSDPATGLGYIVKDLVGKSDINVDYVCLSDGGHFDNMGLYELIRRRCLYIILSDAEEDRDAICEGLANAIRRCRIDFGVEIILDTAPITTKDPNTGLSAARSIKGEIWYPGDFKASGKILYIKTTLTANMPTDIREYQLRNKNFPNQSTSDQFFDESQFESYRKLGYHALDGVVL